MELLSNSGCPGRFRKTTWFRAMYTPEIVGPFTSIGLTPLTYEMHALEVQVRAAEDLPDMLQRVIFSDANRRGRVRGRVLIDGDVTERDIVDRRHHRGGRKDVAVVSGVRFHLQGSGALDDQVAADGYRRRRRIDDEDARRHVERSAARVAHLGEGFHQSGRIVGRPVPGCAMLADVHRVADCGTCDSSGLQALCGQRWRTQNQQEGGGQRLSQRRRRSAGPQCCGRSRLSPGDLSAYRDASDSASSNLAKVFADSASDCCGHVR